MTFLKDKSPMIQRLEYLRLFVMEPEAVAGLNAKGKRNADGSLRATRQNGDLKRKRDETEEGGAPGEGVDSPSVKISLNFKHSTREVQRDASGKPVLPFVAKGATILSLGTIVYDRPGYHAKAYLWPVGFKSQRRLPSMSDPKNYIYYTSEILDGGPAPIFRVSPSDNPSMGVQAPTSSGVWCEMLKLIKKRANVSVSGPEVKIQTLSFPCAFSNCFFFFFSSQHRCLVSAIPPSEC
jgi:hypothetical protein